MSLRSRFKYVEPVSEVFRHDEYHDITKSNVASDGCAIFGARVRGLAHKDEGLNCDDWFEVGSSNGWDIIVVSDGSGSAVFGRVGAKLACEKARDYLSLHLPPIDESLFLDRDKHRDSLTGLVCDAFKIAFDGLTLKVEELLTNDKVKEVLGRQIAINDLDCTLNIAVHSAFGSGSLTIGCQVGDGTIGVISSRGTSRALSKSDEGEFAGGTRFLSSIENFGDDSFRERVSFEYEPIDVVLVMTDGVNVDFIPDSTLSSRVWAELLVNGVPEFVFPGAEDENVSGDGTVSSNSYVTESEIIEKTPRTVVRLRSANKYAESLGKDVLELITRRDLAWKAHRGEIISGFPNKQNETEGMRLRLWLDSFYSRGGSKDDRTLVVLYRKKT
jgi:hypothetical protein